MEDESDNYTNCYWFFWYSYQRIGTGTGRLWNKRTSNYHPNYSFIKISQNSEKSRRLAVPQSSVRNHQLTLMWKTINNCNIPVKRRDLVKVKKKKNLLAKWTLPSWWTTKLKSKKSKRETSSWTLPENWKKKPRRSTRINLQRLWKVAGRIRNRRTSRDYI